MKNNDDFALLMYLNNKPNKSIYLEALKSSPLNNHAKFVRLDKNLEVYLLQSHQGKFQELFDLIKEILVDIFHYNESSTHQISFIVFNEHRIGRQLSQIVGDESFY